MIKMNEENLKQILQEGEGYKIEFKENLSNIDKEIVAFANASGGKIFIGVDDKGGVAGVETTNELDAINAAVEGVNEGVNEGVKKRLINELVYLVRNNFVNRSAIENLCDISTATAERDISMLKKLEFIKFTGAPKTGKYVLTEKGKKIIGEVTAKNE